MERRHQLEDEFIIKNQDQDDETKSIKNEIDDLRIQLTKDNKQSGDNQVENINAWVKNLY